jgi:hypothetical protein
VLDKKYSHKKAFFVLTGNLVITTWLVLPFTGLGMESKKELNDKMTMLPRGLHAQELKPLSQTKFLDSSLENELWLLGSYSKKIGYPLEERYPVQLNSTGKFFADSTLHHFINQQGVLFLSTDTTISANTNFDSSYINVIRFGPGYMNVLVNNPGYRFITFLQNDYPHWETFADGKKVQHCTCFRTFITLPIEKGKHQIEYRFDPVPIKNALWMNIAVIVAGLVLLSTKLRNRQLF